MRALVEPEGEDYPKASERAGYGQNIAESAPEPTASVQVMLTLVVIDVLVFLDQRHLIETLFASLVRAVEPNH